MEANIKQKSLGIFFISELFAVMCFAVKSFFVSLVQ